MIAGENDTDVMPCIRYRVRGIRFLMRGKRLGDGWSDPTGPEHCVSGTHELKEWKKQL